MSELLVDTEKLGSPRDILNYASSIPYSTAAMALRIMGMPINFRFGGSCIDKALIPYLCLSDGSSQLLCDRNKGHFASLIEGKYFDPTFHQAGLEDDDGYYPTTEGRVIKVRRRGGVYTVDVISDSELERRETLLRKRKPDFSFEMAIVNLPYQMVVDQVFGRISMRRPQLSITHGFDPEGLMCLKYDPQRGNIRGYMEPYGLYNGTTSPVDIDRAIEGLYNSSGVGYEELVNHFDEIWSLVPEVYERLKHPRYQYY